MFVIVDDTAKKSPNYFWKFSATNKALITVMLSDAMLFKTQKSAKSFLEGIKNETLFNFRVAELCLKQ